MTWNTAPSLQKKGAYKGGHDVYNSIRQIKIATMPNNKKKGKLTLCGHLIGTLETLGKEWFWRNVLWPHPFPTTPQAPGVRVTGMDTWASPDNR